MNYHQKQEKIWSARNTANFYWSWHTGRKRSKWFTRFLRRYDFDSIFEAGCNSGRNLWYIKEKFDCEIGGIDINENAIQLASEKMPKGRFEVCSLYDMDVEPYDIVFTMGTMIHIPPNGIDRVIDHCIKKASKYVIHIEANSKNSKVLNGPRHLKPKRVKPKFLWRPNLVQKYTDLGFKVSGGKIPSKLASEDLTHIIVIDVGSR